MSKHLHYKTEYCWNCGNVAAGHCSKCGLPICVECSNKYHGKCDVCWEDVRVEMRSMVGIGSMDNGYSAANYQDNR